jgi:tellurite resistance protein TerC
LYRQRLPIGEARAPAALLFFMKFLPLGLGGLRGLLAGSPLWIPFALVVAALVAVDLGVFQKTPREPTAKEALGWSAVWFALASVFGIGVFAARGEARGVEFFTGYVVEQALSVDNLFVMMLVFAELKVPRAAQRRVLVWGILGAVVLRGALVLAGTALVARFHALTYALGALLVYAALKLLRGGDTQPSVNGSRLRGLVSRFVPVTDDFDGARFTVVRDGARYATPLLLALVTIELTDAVFALDSIPAVLGVSTDPLVVFSSNLFAVLGLRSLYFVLARLIDKLAYLKHGVVVVLLVVGAKMLLAWAWTPPAWVSLALVVVILGAAALASPFAKERKAEDAVRS